MKKYAVIKKNQILYICDKLKNAEILATKNKWGVYTVYGDTNKELLEYAQQFLDDGPLEGDYRDYDRWNDTVGSGNIHIVHGDGTITMEIEDPYCTYTEVIHESDLHI